jgi:hypothetical protein
VSDQTTGASKQHHVRKLSSFQLLAGERLQFVGKLAYKLLI